MILIGKKIRVTCVIISIRDSDKNNYSVSRLPAIRQGLNGLKDFTEC